GLRHESARRENEDRGFAGRRVHDFEWRSLRLVAQYSDPESAPERDSRDAHDPEAPGSDQGRDRDSPDDVSRAQLRSPGGRWKGSGDFSDHREAVHRGPEEAANRLLKLQIPTSKLQ